MTGITRGKRSKAALRAFLNEDDSLSAGCAVDSRANELISVSIDDPSAMQAIREVFAGTALPDDQEKVRRILRVRSEIQKEWGDARDSFLAIGRALLALEHELTKAEFTRLRQGSERLFPFSDATATQLRQIARAVDAGRIPVEACPGSYGTAYQITLLTDRQMRAARDRGLIRPNVTRREIMQLRREIHTVDRERMEAVPPGRVDLSHLKDERERLADRRARIAQELEVLDQRIEQLDRLLLPALEESEMELATSIDQSEVATKR